jgi:hypothetical protein
VGRSAAETVEGVADGRLPLRLLDEAEAAAGAEATSQRGGAVVEVAMRAVWQATRAGAYGRDVAGCASNAALAAGYRGVARALAPDLQKREQEAAAQCRLVRCLLGDPFRPTALDPNWLTTTAAVSLAGAAYDERALPSAELDRLRLAILADALEETGAADELIAHLRSPGPHVRGCWAVDLILGKR